MRENYVPVPRADRTCTSCGRTFTPENPRVVYCSEKCRKDGIREWTREYMRQVRAAWSTRPDCCIECGVPIDQPLTNIRVRCEACTSERRRNNSARWNKQRRRERIKELRESGVLGPRKCAECGETFLPKFGPAVTRKITCSTECSQKFHDRLQKQKRRAITAGVHVERVVPQIVFEICDWICQHCGRSLDPALYGTQDRAAPELDHIVPLSLGGKHVYANCQALCKQCNARKGNQYDPERESLRQALNFVMFDPAALYE